jgi:hypothetical protein
MNLVPVPKSLQVAEAKALTKEARTVLLAYEAFLAHPVFLHRVDLNVLAKLMTDDRVPARERRRAAEVVARLELEARRQIAEISCVKEQVLEQLGIAPSPTAQAIAVAQTVTKVEIVRETDWRDGGEREAAGG